MKQVSHRPGEWELPPIPRVPVAVFPRPRLHERLSSWPDIMVVHGPTGSGKTTLLASWLTVSKTRALWCEPEEGRLPFAEVKLFAKAGGGVLVIDQGERVQADQLDQLGKLVDLTPQLKLVVATRSARTIERIAHGSDAAIDVITPVDLHITLEDLRTAEVLHSDEERLELLKRSEGLAIAVREKIDESEHRTSGIRERFRRKLHTELGEEQYLATLQTALLPHIDETIRATWNLPRECFEQLDEAGMGEYCEGVLRIHPYLRSVLAEEAERQLATHERHRLIASAVKVSFIDSDPLLALRLSLQIGDLDLATEVALTNMVELFEMRDETYEVFTGIPISQLRGYPALTVMFAVLMNMEPDTRPRALQLLATESLFQRLHSHRGKHRERVVYRAFEAALIRLTPFSSRALPLIRKAVEDLDVLTDEDMDALGRMGPLIHVHLGIAALYLRDTELARQCFELADAKHSEAGRADRVDPLSLRAGLAALNGELPLARRLLAEADAAEWPEGWRESSPADFFNLGRAVLALEKGDWEAAGAHLAASGPIEDIVEHWPLFAYVRARRDCLAGEVTEGLMRIKNLRRQRGSGPTTAMARSIVDAAEAELHLAAGDPQKGRSVAARSAKHSTACRIALARIELALDRPSAAATQANRALNDETISPRFRLEAEIVLACCSLRMGHRDDAEAVATRITEVVNMYGVRAPFRVVPLQEREALVAVLRQAGVEQEILELVSSDASQVENGTVVTTLLTPREQAVLNLLAETGSLDEIAAKLFVSRNTVKSQLSSVYRKLGVSSREAALTRAAALGVLK